MSDMDPIITSIRSVVLSCPKDILMTMSRLVRDYRELTGGNLPYTSLGFSTPRELVLSYKDHLKFSQVGCETVISIPLSSCKGGEAKIRLMVEKSRRKKPRSKGSGTHRTTCHTSHFRIRPQPTVKQHLDSSTQAEIKSLARIAQKKGFVLTEGSFWSQFTMCCGHRLDYLRFGFKTQGDLLDYAVHHGLLRKVRSPSGQSHFLPCDEKIQSLTVGKELAEILDFLTSLVVSMTGIPLHDLPDLFKSQRGGDFMALAQDAGHHRIYPLVNQLAASGRISICRPSMETYLLGPESSSPSCTVPDRDYLKGGPHRMRVVNVDSIDQLELSLSKESESDSLQLKESLQSAYSVNKVPLVSNIVAGLHCVYHYKGEYIRVRVMDVKPYLRGKLCVFLRRLDGGGDPVYAPLPTSCLYSLVPDVKHFPRTLFTVGLAWIQQSDCDNVTDSWKQHLINSGDFLIFKASLGEKDKLVRVSMQSPDYSWNVGWSLVSEGFAKWIS